jgi:hypothetical protein
MDGVDDAASPRGSTIEAAFEAADIERDICEFLKVYDRRPIRPNEGGMRLNHSFATWFILKTLRPATVIESGVYRGHSTWLIEQACPNARLFSLDPDLSHLVYRSSKSTYLSKDFAECSFADVDPAEVVCFFDDHQNAYQRLKDLRWAGITRAIFEDNYPCGEGDCYTLRHVLKGFGHDHIEMSQKYLGHWPRRWRRRMLEWVLRSVGPAQHVITSPNTVDRELFQRNCAEFFEFPPIVLNRQNDWDGLYDGHYAAKAPICAGGLLPKEVGALVASDPTEASYNFIAYVELKRSTV